MILLWPFSSWSEGSRPSKSESRITSYLKVVCCVLCAFIYVYVNATGLMETGKRKKNGVGFAFLQDPCRAVKGDAQQHVPSVPRTRIREGWGLSPLVAAPAQPGTLLPS